MLELKVGVSVRDREWCCW